MASDSCPPYLGPEINIDDTKRRNPFRGTESELYLYRDIECTKKERARLVQQHLKIYDKTTIASKARSRKALKKLEEAIEKEAIEETEKEAPALNWTLAFAKICKSDKQSIVDYISEQKELFLLEYAVKSKQHTIARLEKMAADEENRAKLAETKLEEDSIAFEEFLKENDRSSVEALKMATQETKSRMEATAERQTAMNELFSLRSDIANTEERLKRYLSCEVFLLSVSPKEFQEKQLEKKKKWKRQKTPESKSFLAFPGQDKSKLMSSSFLLRHKLNKWAHAKGPQASKKIPKKPDYDEKKKGPQTLGSDYKFFRKSSRYSLSPTSSSSEGKRRTSPSRSFERKVSISADEEVSLDDIPSDEEPEIYFKDPEELLQMFRHLEEQNLSLFQNIQDISATLEDRYHSEQIIVQQKEQIINGLIKEKEALTAACIKEEGKSAELALKTKLFSAGEYSPTSMDKVLDSLNKKIKEVYSVCSGGLEVSSLTSFQMLKAVEVHVSELCEMFETLPKEYLDVVEVIEKLRAKERRQRIREDKRKELKRIQEERLKQALERAIAAPKKRMGRKLVHRSKPRETEHGKENVQVTITKSEDDYYFS